MFGRLIKSSTHIRLPYTSSSTFISKPPIGRLPFRSNSSKSHCCFVHKCSISKCCSDPPPRLELEAVKMSVALAPSIVDGCLTVNGKVVSTGVPSNVVVTPATCGSAFLGASSVIPSCRHVFGLGVLGEYKFLSLFRFKLWWMIPRVGQLGQEIPTETQMLLLEATQESALCDGYSSETATAHIFYILLLPVLDGPFRTSLQGAPSNELQFCIESGDASVQTTQLLEAVFVNSGENPFELIKNSIKILEKHKRTFRHIEHKEIPTHLDWFGWCTWDAFYKDVNPDGIKRGLQGFLEGGCPVKFLIIDDGWQDTVNEYQKENEPLIEGTQFAVRLVDINENSRFRSSGAENSCADLHEFVNFIKEKYGLKFVYVWHALLGYWGGLLPSSDAMKTYNPKIAYPKQSPGNTANIRDIAMDSLEKYGVGVIEPGKIYDFYNDLHSYLASMGVDGVKVDVQNVVETLGAGYGGRVSLTRQYQEALEKSIIANFKDNNLISCMSLNTDTIYSSKSSAVARVSEDFMPREPAYQTLHVATVAFNSLFLGEVVVPDWDMFQSNHSTAEFHGAARALGGCPVYVSDQPNVHDFKLLKKLVLPDGSVLRARYAGRPTRDSLFLDPVMDGKSLLKIWNLNKLSGILGVFNCQGAGNWPLKQVAHNALTPKTLSVLASPLDVELLREVAGKNWKGDCAVYAFHSGTLSIFPKEATFKVSLDTLKCEIFTISPVRVFSPGIEFAPLGLVDMFNSGGAIEALYCSHETISVKVRGCGRFGAYSGKRPRYCVVDKKEEVFMYSEDDGLFTTTLEGECMTREISIVY